MSSRGGLAVGVACLVVLSGCGAFVGGSSQPDRETVTPVPVPTDRGEAGTATETTAPPWLSPAAGREKTVNVSALVAAHRATLENQSYTWTSQYRVSRNGSGTFTRTRQVRAGDDAVLVNETNVGTGNRSDVTVYITEGVDYRRTRHASSTFFGRVNRPHGSQVYTILAGEAVRRFMTDVSFDVTVVDRDGRTYYRLHAANGSPPRSLRENGRSGQDYTVTAYVTPEGFVRTLAADYGHPSNADGRPDSRMRVSFRSDYEAVGSTTVERPGWVSGIAISTGAPAANASTPATDSSAPPATSSPAPPATPTPTAPSQVARPVPDSSTFASRAGSVLSAT